MPLYRIRPILWLGGWALLFPSCAPLKSAVSLPPSHLAYNLLATAGGADMAKTKQFTISLDNHPGAVAPSRKLSATQSKYSLPLGTAKVPPAPFNSSSMTPGAPRKLSTRQNFVPGNSRGSSRLPNKPGALSHIWTNLPPRRQHEFHPRHCRKGGKGRRCLYRRSGRKSCHRHRVGASLLQCFPLVMRRAPIPANLGIFFLRLKFSSKKVFMETL